MRPATRSHPHRRNSRTANPEPAWKSGKLDESGNRGPSAWWIECYDSVSMGMDPLRVCHAAASVPRLPEWQSAAQIDCIVFSCNSRTRSLARTPEPYRATSKSSTHTKGNLYTPSFVNCSTMALVKARPCLAYHS